MARQGQIDVLNMAKYNGVENLRLQLAQVELCKAAQPPRIIQKGIQVAMGYCFRESAEKTMEEALHESDAAMYKDKLQLKKLL